MLCYMILNNIVLSNAILKVILSDTILTFTK